MSYDNNYGGGGGGGTGRVDPSEYGGGGRGDDNYYDQRNRYDDSHDSQSGRHAGGMEGRTAGGRYGQGIGSGVNDDDYDDDEVVSHAARHSDGAGDSNLFSEALSFLGKHKQQAATDDIDEGRMVNVHQTVYGSGDGGSEAHSAQTLGAGAAMQALKRFTSGQQDGGAGAGGQQSQSQSQFIGLAMAEASKLFDQKSGNVTGGENKQSVVNEAAKVALKMYLKGQGGGSSSSGGGGSGLMSLAGRFL